MRTLENPFELSDPTIGPYQYQCTGRANWKKLCLFNEAWNPVANFAGASRRVLGKFARLATEAMETQVEVVLPPSGCRIWPAI